MAGRFVEDGAVARIDHADVVGLAQTPGIGGVVQRVFAEDAMQFQDVPGCQYVVLDFAQVFHGAIVVEDHLLAMVAGCPAALEHGGGNLAGG